MSVTESLQYQVGATVGRSDLTDRRVFMRELDRTACADDFVDSLRTSAMLARCAVRSADSDRLVADLTAFAQHDDFARMLAIESASEIRHPNADQLLVDFLTHPTTAVRRHASWRLGRRRPIPQAVDPLLAQLALGGIDTLHAHRTLRTWSYSGLRRLPSQLAGALASTDEPAGRARLVDLLGVVAGNEWSHGSAAVADDLLLTIAGDPADAAPARIAAIAALGERTGGRFRDELHRLARLDDDLGSHAALALDNIDAPTMAPFARTHRGIRIAQLVLAEGLDGQLSLGGRGEMGGVASLLVALGEALARHDDVDHVLTIGTGTVTDALTGPMSSNDVPLSYGMIAVGDTARPIETPNVAWEHVPAIERGIRRLIRLAGPFDVLHLRMADAGTLAGSEVAAALDVPICFSVAPDPHNVLRSLQARGELDRMSFVRLDTESNVWFRARMVERLTRDAERLALFPRSRSNELFEDVGVDPECGVGRSAVVAEGIDVGLIRRIETDGRTTAANSPSGAVAELAGRILEHRRGLPLLLSVGRLHPVKGMERVVAAWASDPRLHERANLVIVGGDLTGPSTTERGVLDAIDRVVPIDDARRAGLVLFGGRPKADVARLLVATRQGYAGFWSGGGVYVDGALKEEFGLALLEALAAGLVVTAPSTGGPATYVEHGDTGVLVEPGADLVSAIGAAFVLVDRPGRVERARAMVETRYSIETMATQLTELYRREPAVL